MVKVSRVSAVKPIDHVWRSIIKTRKTRKSLNLSNSYRNFMFSPSGRWGLAVYQRRAIFGANDKKFVPQVILVDMQTKEEWLYESSCLKKLQEIVEMYWIGENEFILISHLYRKQEFVQMYCSLDKEYKRILVLGATRTRVPHPETRIKFHDFFTPHIGASPLCLNGERYIVLNNVYYLTLVPWNGLYSHAGPLRIDLVDVTNRSHLVLDYFFCYGCCIYIPIFDINRPGKSCTVNKLVCVDVSKLEFDQNSAFVNSDDPEIVKLRFEGLNYQATDFIGVKQEIRYSPNAGVQFRQRRNYVIISEKIDELQLQSDQRQETATLKLYHVLDLKRRTVSVYKLLTDRNDYYVTIYGDSLLFIRNSLEGDHNHEYMTIKLLKKEIPSLLDMARRAIITRNEEVENCFTPFLFPSIHCCDKQYSKFNCICDGKKFLNLKDHYCLN